MLLFCSSLDNLNINQFNWPPINLCFHGEIWWWLHCRSLKISGQRWWQLPTWRSPFSPWGCWLDGKSHPWRMQTCPAGLSREVWNSLPQVAQTHGHGEILQEGRWSFHFEAASPLVCMPGNSYLAARERLAPHSLLLGFQEGDERKLPAALPRAGVSHSILQLGSEPYRPSGWLQAGCNPDPICGTFILSPRGIWMGRSFAIKVCAEMRAGLRRWEGTGTGVTHQRKKQKAAIGASLSHGIWTHWSSGKHR